ncbi:MAG: endolytic transglycosylase MltG [Parcubacteria group bacterium]|nr:endolytic transglycosylase MltG [Parcubacteria group bacterium]
MRAILLFFGIAVVVGTILAGSYAYDAYLIGPSDAAESVAFDVEQGASVEAIAKALSDAEMITSPFFFKVYVRLNDVILQAGSFEITPGSSIRSIVSELAYAEASEVEVTFPEGFTSSQMGAVVVDAFESVSEDDWNEVSGEAGKWMVTASNILAGIPQGQGLEGYLFPDTYRFREDVSAQTIVDTMVLTLKRRMAESEIVIPDSLVFNNGLTVHEVMTLASIVEREVQSVEDMKIVAGIFFTRLQIGMALQADSTVNYITGKSDPGVSLEDSRINSPYNTYKNLGLPPGPISNPGMNSIAAVLDPVDSEYLYFLTTPEGEVIYAASFDQHIANKYKYLK